VLRVVPIQYKHIDGFRVQLAQLGDVPNLGMLADMRDGWCALDGDIPVAFFGYHEMWSNRAVAWSVLSDRCSKMMHRVTRTALRFFDDIPCKRIEFTVRNGFDNGERWAQMLGFRREGFMLSYYPDGGSAYLYARVR
jgi:hypothetical protein